MRAGWLLVLAALLATGCRREPTEAGRADAPGAHDPVQAVVTQVRHLRRNDLAGFARDGVPPDLHPRLQAAWREGRTRWPLDELPFDEQLPTMLAALSAPGAQERLQLVFDHQFAGETASLRTAATTLGLFGQRYVRDLPDLGEAERDHDLRLVDAFSRWAASAPLGDRDRARAALARLTAAARATGIASDTDFTRLGMAASLARLSGFLAAFKAVLASYGLDLDASLDALQAELVGRRGDAARVRIRYRLGSTPIEAVIDVARVRGRWYLADDLRRARAALAPGPPRTGTPAATPPESRGQPPNPTPPPRAASATPSTSG